MPHLAPINTKYDGMNIESAIQSPTVQRSLPDLAGLYDTVGFDYFLANPPPTITSNPNTIREHLRGYADQLERHERFTKIWKHQYANQLVNLRQLITKFDAKCQKLEQQRPRSRADEDASSTIISSSENGDSEYGLLQLGLPEFEDLYYFLACKTRTLYSDLQLRFASKFLTMDDVLHQRGSSTRSNNNCTVRDIRNFLRAIWFHLLHPTIVVAIEGAINHRKYQTLKANPLIPSWSVRSWSPTEREKMEHFKLGLNLDAPTLRTMFDHLNDISAMSVPAMLLKVSQRVVGPHSEYSEHWGQHICSQSSSDGSGNIWIDIEDEDEDYIQGEIHKVERKADIQVGLNTRGHFKSSSADTKRANSALKPSRLTSVSPTEMSRTSCMQGANMMEAPVTAVKFQKWLPNISTNSASDPSPRTPESKTPDFPNPPTPLTTRRVESSVPSTPSNYRIPFHGVAEFPHAAPPPPPKSPSEIVRARELRMRAEMQQLQRDNSQLQAIIQQNRDLQRENSQLQEVLQSTSLTPRGVFRRLSQLGSRARSKSPRKSPRKSEVDVFI